MRPRLRSFELAWTDAAFDAIYPEPPPPTPDAPARFPHGVVRLHPARFFDDLLLEAPLEQSVGLRVALWVIALAPLFTLKRLRTISALSSRDRVRVLEELCASPIYLLRQIVLSFKTVATLLYSGSPQVRARMLAPVRESNGELIRLRSKNGESGHANDPSTKAAEPHDRTSGGVKRSEKAGGPHAHAAE